LITIELQEHFNTQARADHLQRMHMLLTALDLDQGYSQKPDFAETLSALVDQLESLGVTNVYSQACALLSIFAAQLDTQSAPSGQDPQEWVLLCMQQALRAGVSPGSFHGLFEALSGLGRFDQPWPCSQTQINLMDLLAAVHMNNRPLQIPCNKQGPVSGGVENIADDLVNMFRTDSGFMHQVFGQFTPDFLIARLCKTALPENPLQINIDPVFERCEIGRQNPSGFFSLQRIELIDTRLAKIDLKQGNLFFSAEEKQRLRSAWAESTILVDPSVQIPVSWLSTDLNFQAQWAFDRDLLGFFTKSDLRIHAIENSLKWQGNLVHQGAPVSLLIQVQQDIHIHWQHSGIKKPGELPPGEPLWLAEYRVPLHVQLGSAVGVGKSVIQAVSPIAGELVFALSAVVSPVDRILEVVLTVDHCGLSCHWQSVDPVKGGAAGCWQLAPPARMMQRNLGHG
jgi:hypothetical protein